MNGWLLDTNILADLARLHGSGRVRTWTAAQHEHLLFLSILTLGEYDKGVANLGTDNPRRPAIAASVAALETRFAGRVLPLTNAIVRRWGVLS